MKYPVPKKIPFQLTKHGHERIDSYFWMSDRENLEVLAHLKAENKYTDTVLSPTKKVQKTLFKEMKSRLNEDDSSAPYFKNGYWYYTRFEKGDEYAIHCRKLGTLVAKEEILFDENEMAEGYDYYEIDGFALTQNNKIVAFTEDLSGNCLYQIRFKNTETGEILPHILHHCESELAWHGDNETLYYVEKETETLRPFRLKSFHILTGEIVDLYEEKDEAFSISVDTTGDYQYIFMGCHSSVTTEYHFKSAMDNSEFVTFLKRIPHHEYYLESGGDRFYIKSNWEAPNFKLASCLVDQRELEHWEIIQRTNADCLIEDFELFDQYLVLQEKVNGLTQVRVYDRSDFSERLIPPTEETFTLYLENNPESAATVLRIGYSSLTTPHSIYDIDLTNFNWKLIKQTEILGDFEPTDYHSERVWAKASDGISIPISLVYKKSLFNRDGKNPILIYGYGAYGSTVDPYFSSARLSLLDRGFVFAIAHVRGSEYLGTAWYEAGKLTHKKNTFTDYITAAEHLIANGYGNPTAVFGMGGSAGGLLMAAVANMRPDIWKALILQVPFVDVVTTMLNDSLPLTAGEYDEWGNPNIEEDYWNMLSYSPYDQLEAKNYPHLYVSSGLNDTQVQFWEPTKYVAKLRELKTDSNHVLLRTYMKAGHGGASGRYEQLHEIAEEYAFILHLLESVV